MVWVIRRAVILTTLNQGKRVRRFITLEVKVFARLPSDSLVVICLVNGLVHLP